MNFNLRYIDELILIKNFCLIINFVLNRIDFTDEYMTNNCKQY